MSTNSVGHDEFPTQATGAPAEEPSHVLKKGETFALFDRHGDLSPQRSGRKAGVYHQGTRFLSRYELTVFGRRPLLLDSGVTADGLQLGVDLMNPDCPGERDLALTKGALHIQRTLLLLEDGMLETIGITNYSGGETVVRIELRCEADFRDVFEVRGAVRPRRGTLEPAATLGAALQVRYNGLDEITRQTTVRFTPAVERWSGGTAIFEPTIAAAGTLAMKIEVVFVCGRRAISVPAHPAGVAQVVAEREQASGSSAAVITSSNDSLNALLEQCERDLQLLTTQMPEGPYPYAGIPWYSTVFGRDGLITALQRLWLDPGLARGVLANLSVSQARSSDEVTEAEPGKIIHEQRSGEMANTGEIPFGRYYGSVDSTPLFVLLAGAYLRRTGDVAFVRGIWPHVRQAIAWMDQNSERDDDGFLHYPARPGQPLLNQCWKDSSDAIFHRDGAPANGPIAVCEVQGYAYAARRAAGRIARALGESELAESQYAHATAIKARFEERFWLEELGTYALALDGEKRPCAVRTSNAGQCLATGIAREDHARRIADQMLSPAFFSGWGIRTVAAGERGYNPMSYHNGSVWPHDCGLIARGLARYGRKRDAGIILAGLLDLSRHVENNRLPELICGFDRQPGLGPALYPVTCMPQAWAAGSIFMILESCLGISIDAQARAMTIESPHLPEFLAHLTVRGLDIGDGEVDLTFLRTHDATAVRIDRGDAARVRIVP